MARFGMRRARATSAAVTAAPVVHPDRTVNKAGGEAFEIRDPSLRLLSMLGSSFWNEPQYYPDADGPRAHNLTSEAARIVETAREIAASANPRDLLALALWARSEMNIRTTPQVLLAIAAHEPGTKRFVRAYAPRIVQRADEVRQVFAAFLALFASGVGANARGQKLPNSLKRGLADALGKFSEVQYLKYDSDVRPTFRDVLRMVDRRKHYGLPQPLYNYLLTGEVTDPVATPVIAARKRLAQKTVLDAEARALIRATHASWEVVLSQFGSTRAVWEAVLPELGYMALLRNLRNLASAGVPLDDVARRLADRDEVARSRQLPLRFYAAYAALAAEGKPSAVVTSALEAALGHAIAALPKLPGTTVVASDNSGSMTSAVSAKSAVTRQAVANLMAAIAHRTSDAAHVVVFGQTASLVPLADNVGIFAAMQRQAATDVGHSTNAHEAVRLMLSQKLRADRLLIFSDMQCWNDSGSSESLAGMLRAYRRAVNPGLFVHSIDLAGSGKSAVVPDEPRTNLLSGFSEKVLESARSFERAVLRADEPATGAPYREAIAAAMPSIDDLRARF